MTPMTDREKSIEMLRERRTIFESERLSKVQVAEVRQQANESSWEEYHKWADEQERETSRRLQENWDKHKASLAADTRDNWMHALIWLGVTGACIMARLVWIPLFFG